MVGNRAFWHFTEKTGAHAAPDGCAPALGLKHDNIDARAPQQLHGMSAESNQQRGVALACSSAPSSSVFTPCCVMYSLSASAATICGYPLSITSAECAGGAAENARGEVDAGTSGEILRVEEVKAETPVPLQSADASHRRAARI